MFEHKSDGFHHDTEHPSTGDRLCPFLRLLGICSRAIKQAVAETARPLFEGDGDVEACPESKQGIDLPKEAH